MTSPGVSSPRPGFADPSLWVRRSFVHCFSWQKVNFSLPFKEKPDISLFKSILNKIDFFSFQVYICKVIQ